MKLTMEACGQIQSTCEGLQQLEMLNSVEEFNGIREEITNINRSICEAMHTLESLNAMRNSLVKCGYSDEWFDQVRATPGFEGLVQIDMQKFFGGMQARQEVCMEGFMDTIKRWIENVWKFIQWLFKKILDGIEWVLNEIGRKQNAEAGLFKEMWRRNESKFADYFGVKSWELDNFYEYKSITEKLENVNTLIRLFYNGQNGFLSPNDNFMKQGIENTDPKDAKHLFVTKLNAACNSSRIKCSSAVEDGFEFARYSDSNNKVLMFFGEKPGEDFPKENIKIDSAAVLEEYEKWFTTTWVATVTHVNQAITDAKSCLISEVNMLKGVMRQFDRTQNDPRNYDELQIELVQVACALTITEQALGFIARCRKATSGNMKAILDIMKDISNWKPGYAKTAEKFGVHMKPGSNGIWNG